MSPDRRQEIDFTEYTYMFNIGMFTRRPLPKHKLFTTLKPLDPFSWFGFLLGALIVGCLAKLILWVMKPDFQQRGILTSVFLMLFQPYSGGHKSWVDQIVQNWPGYILMNTWCIGLITFDLFYSSILRSTLMSTEYEKPIDTIQGIYIVDFYSRELVQLKGSRLLLKAALNCAKLWTLCLFRFN
jgi:hypothetical protein